MSNLGSLVFNVTGKFCVLQRFLCPIAATRTMPPFSASLDHFADAEDITASKEKAGSGYVHLRIQQRNGRKSLTTVQGLATDLDLKKILKALKKVRAFTSPSPLSDRIRSISVPAVIFLCSRLSTQTARSCQTTS